MEIIAFDLLKQIITLLSPIGTVDKVWLYVVILFGLFWLKFYRGTKDSEINNLKSQNEFLMKLNTESFVEKLIEREKNEREKAESLGEEVKRLQEEKKTEMKDNQKIIDEKESEIRNLRLSTLKTSTAINASLDSISASGTIGRKYFQHIPQEDGSYHTTEISRKEEKETPSQRALKPDKGKENK